MSLSSVLGKFDQSRFDHARYPVLGTIAGAEKVVMGVVMSVTALVVAILTLLPSLFNQKARAVFFDSFSFMFRGIQSVAWGSIIVIPLVGSFSHYKNTRADPDFKRIVQDFEEGSYYDATIPVIGICAAAYRILWGVVELIVGIAGLVLSAIPAFFDRDLKLPFSRFVGQGVANIFQGVICAIPLLATLREALPSAQAPPAEAPCLDFFQKAQDRFSIFSPVPVLGTLPAIGKVIIGVVQSVSALVLGILMAIPALFHEGSQKVLQSCGKHLQAGLQGCFEGVIETIPLLGMVAVAMRKLGKERKPLDLEHIALECEGQLSLWAPYPLFGTFCGVGKMLLGTLQCIMALAAATLSALPALISQSCRPFFHRSTTHLGNGAANILSGLFEAMPFIGPLFFAIRSSKADEVSKAAGDKNARHFSWVTYSPHPEDPIYPTPARPPKEELGHVAPPAEVHYPTDTTIEFCSSVKSSPSTST